MKTILFITINILLLALLGTAASAKDMISIDNREIIVCPAVPNILVQPTFLETGCFKTSIDTLDPQKTAIWVKTNLNIPVEMLNNKHPYSVYVSGKTSSRAYLNGQLIGQNGTPSVDADDEFPGKIDASFYVKPSLIKVGSSELVLLMSSHHGLLRLASPINFIGFGVYAAPSQYILRHIWLSFIPLGALVLGALYFAVSCFAPYNRQNNVLFLLMSTIAASQLIIELSRAIFSYSYPFHDIRLLIIVFLSFSFGSCLLLYIAVRFTKKLKIKWTVLGISLSLIAIIMVPGFDGKTALAILIPSLISTTIIAILTVKQPIKEHWIYLVVFISFSLIIIFNLTRFHDLFFYYFITVMLGFLFVQQALKLSKEQFKRKEEEKQVAKLQFKLEQNLQATTPNNITISSAGKIELIPTNEISFCKAAGDYVEIIMKDKKERLFSGNLKELHGLLPSTFLRVHRSYIVNMDYIVSLESDTGHKNRTTSGSGLLLLKDDREVPVSRRIMPKVRNAISQ